ncbi:hypothetical protein [Staphylococcus xylosus]
MDIDKAIKETERKILESQVAQNIESNELRPFYQRLKKRGYTPDQAIGIIVDMFETVK